MNKTELKKFAVNARRELLKQVKVRANLFGIKEKTGLVLEEQFGQLIINGNPYPLYMKSAFSSLQKQLEQKGYDQVLEEVAYIWFNRIIAIRYMEVHDYLPDRVNVLSSSTGRIDPDILTEYETMELPVNKAEVRELLAAGDTEGAYRLLFISQCNALNEVLPFMFEEIQDYTELLLPDYLLDKESIIKLLVKNDDLTESFKVIEVIGWIYQYYIAEEKDRVFKQNSKYTKEEIPYATQLFTPKWIVQYMVQNSLGRYWTEAHPEHEDLIRKWDYFLEKENENFKEEIAPYVNKELKVEDIKCFDPAMGSGHILVYMFDVLYEIYTQCGYPERDIPRLILENNLYGLDIDDRAYQLASFSVVMKAVQYSKRFLRGIQRDGITLNLASIQETNNISDEVIVYITGEGQGENYTKVKAFFDQYHNAKTYGSLINISERDVSFLKKRLNELETIPVNDLFQTENHDIALKILPQLIKQTKIMHNEYDIVVLNPPYMGTGNMSKELANFLKKNYPDSKADLFAAFMEIDHYLKNNGFYGAINQHSWMFLSGYKNLRLNIMKKKTIENLVHLGARTFEEISGEVVQSTTFVFRNYHIKNYIAYYLKLNIKKNAEQKAIAAKSIINNINASTELVYQYNQEHFLNMPKYIIAYWMPNEVLKLFQIKSTIQDVAPPKKGLVTMDNNRFLRLWFEVSQVNSSYLATSKNANELIGMKWVPHSKGGLFRKWYGNRDYVINWYNDGKEIKDSIIKKYKGGSYTKEIRSESLYFKPMLSWSGLSSGSISFRLNEKGFIFDTSGPAAFPITDAYEILGYLNSKVVELMLSFLSPTLSFLTGDIAILPYKNTGTYSTKIKDLVIANVNISQADWDSDEISWDFKLHPLLTYSSPNLQSAFNNWKQYNELQFNRLKTNEEELNRIFIDIYGLQEELTPNIDDKDITIRKANLSRDVRSLLSYFIGCVVGRYSLDVKGLSYAGGNWDDAKYSSFMPNKYGFVQFTDTEYFEHDIIARLREFLMVAFNADMVDENIKWLAEALEMKGGESVEARLRRYFMDEFFVDHCRTYQKRPIYWLVDSGKQKGLRTLIYMHRYQPDTMATIRYEHLQEIQAKYNHEINAINTRLVNPNLSPIEKRKLDKQKTIFNKRLEELLEFDKKLAGYANAQIPINLDDGVVVNYVKFEGVLGKIK